MSVKYYTLEEIAVNNGKDGKPLWFIHKNNVYDCTDYAKDHPGGGELIEEWGGKNATKAFNEAGHSADARDEMKQYKIGEVALEQRKGATKKEKGPKVVDDKPSDKPKSRSCINIITCGLIG
ncbi:cytochrome b5 [Agrilus planipennis]|uniref:Cytochrome b5 n=1 Tax=Agrilus planipennis TaxID=224129 RepID=A0A1W4WLV7_AGRPL|nr:cytochrome b5 [Agrilus planipennis]